MFLLYVIIAPNLKSTLLRNRDSGSWLSKELANRICSRGCHIVCAAHDLSGNGTTEFRFSCSLADFILSSTLPLDVKRGYVAFKALVKNVIKLMETECKWCVGKKLLKSYHLRNVLFWLCESVSPTIWTTSRNGWSRCFLLLIDPLLET